MSRQSTNIPAGEGAVNAGERHRLVTRGLTRHDVIEDLKTIIAKAGNSRGNAGIVLDYSTSTIINLMNGNNPISGEMLDRLYGIGVRNKLQLAEIFETIDRDTMAEWALGARETPRASSPPVVAALAQADVEMPSVLVTPVEPEASKTADDENIVSFGGCEHTIWAEPTVQWVMGKSPVAEPTAASAVAMPIEHYGAPFWDAVAVHRAVMARRDVVRAEVCAHQQALILGTAELDRLEAALLPLEELAA